MDVNTEYFHGLINTECIPYLIKYTAKPLSTYLELFFIFLRFISSRNGLILLFFSVHYYHQLSICRTAQN